MPDSALDRHIADLVARAPRMTAEQRDKIRRVFRYGGNYDKCRRPDHDWRDYEVVYYVERDGLIKIGTSYQPIQRTRQLRGELLATEPGSFKKERERHEQFATSRCGKTEWFVPTPELWDHIESLA